MKIQFVDRETAKKAIANGELNNCQFISVSDDQQESDEIRSLYNGATFENSEAIYSVFQDVEDLRGGFTLETAGDIVHVIGDAHRHRRDIVVHCFAGISRSGAIAKFANEYLALEDEYLNNYRGHNLWVFETLMEAAGVETLRAYYSKQEAKK